jgi:hypothetical protein
MEGKGGSKVVVLQDYILPLNQSGMICDAVVPLMRIVY